jgi:hypothetical protein
MRAQGGAGFAGEAALFNSSGTKVTNSEVLSFYYSTASGASTAGTGTARTIITTSGAETYTLRAYASTGSFSSFNDNNGRTGVVYVQLTGGYIGATGLQGATGLSSTTKTIAYENLSAGSSILGANFVSAWAYTYNSTGGNVEIRLNYTAYATITSTKSFSLYIDGVEVSRRTFFFNTTNTHLVMPELYELVTPMTAGNHTIQFRMNDAGTTIDQFDYASLYITKY